MFVKVFWLCISPLKKAGPFIWTNLTSLCHVWLKFAQWFWRRFVNFINVFSLFRNYLPLEKGRTLKETWILSLIGMLCAKFVWNWSSVSGEEDENVNNLWQQRWRQRWRLRQLTKDTFWSEKPWAQVSLKNHLVNLDRLKQQNHLQVYWSKFKMLNPWFNINARKMADLTICTHAG